MLDILLINPPWTKKGGNIWKSVSGCMPPIGLAVLASYLESLGAKAKILDTCALEIPLDDLKYYIKEHYEKPRFIGITGSTLTIKYAYETARMCKKNFPDAKIILGGVHASCKPEEAVKHEEIDYVVIGEGEYTFEDLLSGKPLKEILGLVYKKNGKIIRNKDRPLIKNLDDLPFPAYHLLPMNKYYPAVGSYKRLPAISMVVTRGCPGKCTFCYQPYGNSLRYRSAQKIIDEIKYLKNKYGIKEILFYDDNFTTIKKNVKEFCDILIKEDIAITWSCFARVDWIDTNLLKLMKKAGCHQIMYGIESGDQQILNNIKKSISLEKIRDVIKETKRAGIECRASFMIGNPGETLETVKKTINFAIELDPDISIFNITAPNPGTEMYEWAEKNGYLTTKKWEEFDLYQPVMNLPTISNEDIKKYYKIAYRRFYCRPKYVLKRFLKIRSINDIKNILSGVSGILDVTK